MPLTAEQMARTKQWRDEGLSYEKIANRLGCSETPVYRFFKPPPPPKPKQPPPPPPPSPPSLLPPPKLFHGSVPLHRIVRHEERIRPQMTKPELVRTLHAAVIATGRRP